MIFLVLPRRIRIAQKYGRYVALELHNQSGFFALAPTAPWMYIEATSPRVLAIIQG